MFRTGSTSNSKLFYLYTRIIICISQTRGHLTYKVKISLWWGQFSKYSLYWPNDTFKAKEQRDYLWDGELMRYWTAEDSIRLVNYWLNKRNLSSKIYSERTQMYHNCKHTRSCTLVCMICFITAILLCSVNREIMKRLFVVHHAP